MSAIGSGRGNDPVSVDANALHAFIVYVDNYPERSFASTLALVDVTYQEL